MPNPPVLKVEEIGISAEQNTFSRADWLDELAFRLAKDLRLSSQPGKRYPIPLCLKELETSLRSAYRHFQTSSQGEMAISHATEWLLDNFHIVEQTLRQVEEGLPASFYRRLPKINVNNNEISRIHLLAHVLISNCENSLDGNQLQPFIQAYQKGATLKIGEVWALPLMLRLCVLEVLASALANIAQLPFLYPGFLDKSWLATWSNEAYSPPSISDENAVINSIVSLRMLATQDWNSFFESTNLAERELRKDPANIYIQMDFETRNSYRNVIEDLATGTSIEETEIAVQAVQLALKGEKPSRRHVGYYLIGPGRSILEESLGYRPASGSLLRRWIYKNASPVYLGNIALFTALFCSIVIGYAIHAGANILQTILAGLLTVLPAASVVTDLINWTVVHFFPPRTLPRCDFKSGIPKEFSTIVVIPSLIRTETEIQFLLHQLEIHYLGNSDPHVHFALLTDFVDAPQKEMPGEEQLVEGAKIGIELLNKRYGTPGDPPFHLFHRERTWNPAEDCWMGWERKRGKLVEFNSLITGKVNSTFTVQLGDLNPLLPIKYVLTLDADTILTRGSVNQLVGTLAHPLNQAEFDPETGTLTGGYTVLQPRVQVRTTAANQSLFTRLYSGDVALDLYTRAVSDVYQDLFGEGSYVGKGIYDVIAFERCLEERIPDNAILSHDLFEGIHCRCGLVTNVVLFEDYPSHYLTFTHRRHRWTRGDWQLLPWLMPHVPHRKYGNVPNELSLLDRWKIFDNLRRSLFSPSVLALLVASWLFLPGASIIWTVLALSAVAIPVVTSLLAALHTGKFDHSPYTTRPVRQAFLRSFFEIVFLPYESLIIIDAIVTTLIRLIISRKRLLQWVTSAHTVALFGKELKVRVAWHAMYTTPLFGISMFIVAAAWQSSVLLLITPLLICWILSPYIAAYISRNAYPEPEKISAAQEHTLRLLARKTWLYFEHFVGPDDHWLPPDHFQEDPGQFVAHRTSPTNIGLLLLSTLAAYDLGYIGPQELLLRSDNTFDGMDRLTKQRGHFFNWYDTRTLNPLPPRYISTVDSGNLAACLLTLQTGCQDIAERPVFNWEGLIDTLDVLNSTLFQANFGSAADELHNAIHQLQELAKNLNETRQCSPKVLVNLFRENRTELEGLVVKAVEESAEQLDPDMLRQLSTWVDRTRHHLTSIERELQTLCPWSMLMAEAPALFSEPTLSPELATSWGELVSGFSFRPPLKDIPDICTHALENLQAVCASLAADNQDAINWCEIFAEHIETARTSALSLLGDIRTISTRAEAFIQEMKFDFLFDPQRQVFHIGYNVESGRLDPNYYDLLASEARITSLLAIAKGDVPPSHWLHLARPITQVNGTQTLLSWSGTMFEYLMPSLLIQSYPDSLLDQSCRVAVEQQIAYGKQKGHPWGISESSFYYFDTSQGYQYRSFGVPGLGYKRGLAEDYVAASYATILALPFAPQAAMQNLGSLQNLNMLGLYGLYESVDFTPERMATGQDHAVVQTYMAHHQGMTMLALCNHVHDQLMVRRFHADPRIQSVEWLLQEQSPLHAPIEHSHPLEVGRIHPVHSNIALDAWHSSAKTTYPQVHCISNGRYSTIVSSSGSGYSRWKDIDLTRWRADTTLDNWGTWIYIQDLENKRLWSAGYQPTATPSSNQEVHYYPHKINIERRDNDLSLRMTVAIALSNDVEIRQITLTNHSNLYRHIALTSYAEVILSPQEVDQRHPAFNKMFIESEYSAEERALIFRRRPRSEQEKPVFLAHFAVSAHEEFEILGHETDRARFLGRGNTPRSPAALRPDSDGLSCTAGATLDPIFALQTGIIIPPYETIQLAYGTLVANSRKEALELVHYYCNWNHLAKAIEESRGPIEQELLQLGLSSYKLELIQKLLSALLYPNAALRADPATLASNTLGQPGLWPFSISGDYPILLVRIKDEDGFDILSELLQAHTYWRRRGLVIDLVILNLQETGYDQGLRGQIHRLLTRTRNDDWLYKRGGVFLINEDQMAKTEKTLLASAARVVIECEAGTLAQQLGKLDRPRIHLPHFVPVQHPDKTFNSAIVKPTSLQFDNGWGGFTPDGKEYNIFLDRDQWTPLPWINVIANPGFGFLVSETGLGCTWAGNSGENRLTPWHNDPVSNPPSEAIYLRDEDTGQIWSPTPLPARADAPYLIRHGAGYSIFEHNSHGLVQQLRVFAATDSPIKLIQLKLQNVTQLTRRINITYYAEWVLGSTRESMAAHIIPEFDSQHFALLAHNPYNFDFGQQVAFLAATRELQYVTADRSEFLGPRGSYAHPAALERVGLTSATQAGSDPCAAMQILLWLAPGETKEVTFLLGQGTDRSDAYRLIKEYQNPIRIEVTWNSVCHFWDDTLDKIQVRTPDPAMDILLNRWLLYQTLACRFWGRSAFYQSSGAFGYRDQLQDILALLSSRPALARQHILDAAGHQFEQGDVLHWWHPPSGRGIRTRCSDNLLWLPYVTAQYVNFTGDRSILDEDIPFLVGEPLADGENERYGEFTVGKKAKLYEHCLRGLARGTTAGPHGIPLIGSSDWNDGMNRVGIDGKGESIWLGWFLYATLMEFADVCDLEEDSAQANNYRKQARTIRDALEAHGWDGNWYRRAYFDDGTLLGSIENKECQIDSISQSWGVISKAADPDRAQSAMNAVYERLVQHENGIILLLTPPFDRTLHNPGYIQGYLPGIRENGGQYTHAALWVAWAFAKLGDGDRAGELFRLLNPIYHSDTPEKVQKYRVEPYVVAADVYSMPPHVGRGGWTWYTGSANWMYRLGMEAILGLQRRGNILKIDPCIPKDWPSYELDYWFGNSCYHLRVENPHGVNCGVTHVVVDGKSIRGSDIPMKDDGNKHSVEVTLENSAYDSSHPKS